MQPLSYCVRRLGIALLLAWTASGAWAQTAPVPPSPAAPTLSPAAATQVSTTRVGSFKRVQGDAWVGADTARRAVQLGARVGLAHRLSSGPRGAATPMPRDDAVLTTGPDTTMGLRQFQFDGTTQHSNFLFDLTRGSVRVATGLLAKASPELFEAQTPTSVVGVRGTDFTVETQDAC